MRLILRGTFLETSAIVLAHYIPEKVETHVKVHAHPYAPNTEESFEDRSPSQLAVYFAGQQHPLELVDVEADLLWKVISEGARTLVLSDVRPADSPPVRKTPRTSATMKDVARAEAAFLALSAQAVATIGYPTMWHKALLLALVAEEIANLSADLGDQVKAQGEGAALHYDRMNIFRGRAAGYRNALVTGDML